MAGALAVLLVASLVASAVAYYQARVAADQLADAESRRLATLAEQYLDTWPRQSQLLAAAAWQRGQTRQAREALLATQNQRLETVLHGHTDVVQTVAYSPDGKQLASGSLDRTVRLWNLADRTSKVLFEAEGAVNAVAFSPNGKELAVASTDENLYLIDAATGRVKQRVNHRAPVLAVAYSPDGNTVITTNGTPQLWNAATGKLIGEPFLGHTDIVTSVLFTKDGRSLISSGVDGTIRLWRVDDHSLVRTIETGDVCQFLAYDPNENVVACRDHAVISRWDLATGQKVGEPLAGHKNTIRALAFGYDGQVLASTSEDRTVRLWYLATGQQIGEPMRASNDDTFSIQFSPDNRLLAAASADHNIVLWRTNLPAATGRTESSALSQDGKRIAFASRDAGTVTIFDVATRKAVPGAEFDCEKAGSPKFSADARRVAAPCDDTLTVWTTTGDVVAEIKMNAVSVAFSPDGKTLAVAAARGGNSNGGRVVLVDLAGSRPETHQLWSSSKRTDLPWSVAFDPRGELVAFGTTGGALHLWDVAKDEEVGKPLTGHVDTIQEIEFQPHGNLLATAGWDNTVRLWNLDRHAADGVPLVEHTDRPVALSFSPDGRRLASAGWDGVPLVWNVSDHSVYAALHDPASVQTIGFVNSHDLVGTGPNGVITTFDIDPDTTHADVCSRLSPGLTQDEWRQFAPDLDYVAQC